MHIITSKMNTFGNKFKSRVSATQHNCKIEWLRTLIKYWQFNFLQDSQRGHILMDNENGSSFSQREPYHILKK